MSKNRVILLVSPHPVDGYPPVQHQARLLAYAGWQVELLTSPLAWKHEGIRFSHDGVRIHEIPNETRGRLNALWRARKFIERVSQIRKANKSRLLEVAFEPIGMFYSDFARFRPLNRIAHFHECLHAFETSWIEKRLVSSVKGFQLIVVPDAGRGDLLATQLPLDEVPSVVPNYPMRLDSKPRPACRNKESIEVAYCGSISSRQMLHVVVKSIKHWPSNATFRIIGDYRKPAAQEIMKLGEEEGVAHRVTFSGWVPYDEVPEQLASSDIGISLLDTSYEQWQTALGASNKRYQYMQAGLPQIGDMNPGVPELLEEQQIGLCVSEFDEIQIAARVQSYVESPDSVRADGDRAFKLHQDRYNYEQAYRPILEWLSHRELVDV